MARGWESKSVEEQIEQSNFEPSANPDAVTTQDRQTLIKRNDLLLSRKRVVQQLEGEPNQRYAEFLRRTLADLEAQIAELS